MTDFLENVWVKNLLIPFAVFALFFLISVPAARLIFRLVSRIAEHSGAKWGEKADRCFRKPFRVILVAAGCWVAFSVCPAVWENASAQAFLTRLFRSILAASAAWGFCRMTDAAELENSSLAKKFDARIDKTLLPVLSGVIRFLILALAVLVIAQEWDFSISGLVAGLGLGGLAFALAAKDMLSNLFGGLVILLDRPFAIGDWIRTGDVEGTVEDLNFRSLRIRTIEQELVTVPNSTAASLPIYNISRMKKRRVDLKLTVEYGYSAERLESCAARLRALLTENALVEKGSCVVALNGLDDSGPTFRIICYLLKPDYLEFLSARGSLCEEILKALEKEKISLAYPTSKVFVEPPSEG